MVTAMVTHHEVVHEDLVEERFVAVLQLLQRLPPPRHFARHAAQLHVWAWFAAASVARGTVTTMAVAVRAIQVRGACLRV